MNQPLEPSTPGQALAQSKERLQLRVAETILSDFEEYRLAARADGDPDSIRKLLDMQIRLIGAEAEKKVDPNAGLAVFNISIGTNGVSAVVQPMTQQVVLEDQPHPDPTTQAVPELAPLATPRVHYTLEQTLVDAVDLLEGLGEVGGDDYAPPADATSASDLLEDFE